MKQNRLNGIVVPALAVAAALAISACSPTTQAGRDELKQPVNCKTAEGDLRVLAAEQKHVKDQQAAGVTSIIPAGAVIGVVSGTEDANLKVLSGDYQKQLDAKVKEIKTTCKIS